jgi:hypothetical protein
MMLAKQANMERRSRDFQERRAAVTSAAPAPKRLGASSAKRAAVQEVDEEEDYGDNDDNDDAADDGDARMAPADDGNDDGEVEMSPMRRKPLSAKTNRAAHRDEATPASRQFNKTKVANPFAKMTPVKKPTSAGIGDLGATTSPDAKTASPDRKHGLSFLKQAPVSRACV